MPDHQAVGGEVVLHQIFGGGPDAPHIRVQIAGGETCGVCGIHLELGVISQIPGDAAVEAVFDGPCPIRTIGKARGVAIGGDGDGTVFKVIGEGAGVFRACAVPVVDQRVAVVVIANRLPADRGRGMGPEGG